MTRKHCTYTACGLPLRADKSQFEVRVAPDYEHEGGCPGSYCDAECWEAQKAVHQLRKCFADAETMLSETQPITG